MKAFLFLVAVVVCAWLLMWVTYAQAWIIQTLIAFAFPDYPWTVSQVWAVLMMWCVFHCPLWLRKIWSAVLRAST